MDAAGSPRHPPEAGGAPYAAGVDRLSRLRAPLAVTALVALTLVALARVVLGVSELVGVGGSTAVAAARLAPNGGDGALTLLAGVLVVWCFAATEVPGRRGFAVWGVALAAVSLAASVAALALTDLEIAGWSVVWLVPDLVVPALVGVALGVLATWEPVDAPEEVPEPAAAPPVPTPDPALAPSWPEDEAAGAVWRTAGEAAQGAPASGWGTGSATPWSRPALPPGPGDEQPAP